MSNFDLLKGLDVEDFVDALLNGDILNMACIESNNSDCMPNINNCKNALLNGLKKK